MPKIAKKNTLMAKAYVVIWTEMMYLIWIQRCQVAYQDKRLPETQVIRSILFYAPAKLPNSTHEFLIL